MNNFTREFIDYMSLIYSKYYGLFTKEGIKDELYSKIILRKYEPTFSEFLKNRNVDENDIADYILTFYDREETEKNRVEPIVALFNRSISYFLLKSSIYKLRNNPIDIYYENTGNPYYDEVKKYIPMLYSITLIPNKVANKDETAFSSIFYASKDKRNEIQKKINLIAYYLHELIKSTYEEMEKKDFEYLNNFYNYMLEKIIQTHKKKYQYYTGEKHVDENNLKRLQELLEEYTSLHNYSENITMNDYFRIISEMNKVIGDNKLYKVIAVNHVIMLFFTNPFVKFLGFDIINIVDNYEHFEKGIENLKSNFNLPLKDRKFLIKNYKLNEKGLITHVDIDFDVIEDPAEIVLLFYKDMPKERFEKVAKVFYDLSMLFSIGNVFMSLRFVKEENNQKKIKQSMNNILGKFISLYDEFEKRYIFGKEDFYLDIVNDEKIAKKFLMLAFLSYVLFDNALFFYSPFFGVDKDERNYFSTDIIHLAVATSTYNILSIPLIFYSAISGFLGINTKINQKEQYKLNPNESPINNVYDVIEKFDRDIQYDITDYFELMSLMNANEARLTLLLFEALSSASFDNFAQRVIFSELNGKNRSSEKRLFDTVGTLSSVKDGVRFTTNTNKTFVALPLFDKMVLSYAGITSISVATIVYDEKKANYVRETSKNRKIYTNKPLELRYMETNGVEVKTNLYHYINYLKNPVFNYFGFVVGLTQFSSCNPYISLFFGNVVNCRSNLFSQRLTGKTIERSTKNVKYLPINEVVVFGPIANYLYAEFLNREFNLGVKYDFNQSLKKDLVEKVDAKLFEIRSKIENLVEEFNRMLIENYQSKIAKYFANHLFLNKKSLISVYTERAFRDLRNMQKRHDTSITVSNSYPANVGVFALSIPLAGAIVYSILSEMFLFEIDKNSSDDKNEKSKEISNAFRIAESYIYGKFAIPNLLFNWIVLFNAFAGRNDNYKRTISDEASIFFTLFSPEFKQKINSFDELRDTNDKNLILTYLYSQYFSDKIKDTTTKEQYESLEKARISVLDEIDEEVRNYVI